MSKVWGPHNLLPEELRTLTNDSPVIYKPRSATVLDVNQQEVNAALAKAQLAQDVDARKALAQAQAHELKRLEAKKRREEVRKVLDRSMNAMFAKDRDEI